MCTYALSHACSLGDSKTSIETKTVLYLRIKLFQKQHFGSDAYRDAIGWRAFFVTLFETPSLFVVTSTQPLIQQDGFINTINKI